MALFSECSLECASKCLTPPTLSERRFFINCGLVAKAAYTTLVWRISLTQSVSHPGVKGRYETVSKVCRSSHRYIVCCDNIASVRGSTNHFPRCICLRTEQTYFSRRRTGWIQRRFHWGLNSVARFALLDIKRRVAVYSHA